MTTSPQAPEAAPTRTRMSGLAVAGLLVSAFVLLLLAISFYLHYLAPEHYDLTPMMKARQIGMATVSYAADQRGDLPPADSWEQVLVSANYLTEETLRYSWEEGRGFAMNSKLSRMNISQVRDRNKTVLFFECAPGAPPAGCPEYLPSKPRHRGGFIVCFCDGHVERVPPEEVKDLRWDP